MTLDLHNFFKFYDDGNANHVAAVQWLEDNLPAEFLDDSETEWIGMFRTKPIHSVSESSRNSAGKLSSNH